jgi:predicted nucleic acid-binding protein
MIVFDSSAWLEYFSGSNKGKVVRDIIESQEEILTPSVCISEIKRKYLREEKEYKSRVKFITDRSKIIKIDLNIASIAADISYKEKLYMVDALVYACAVFVKSSFLTGDHHFEKLKNIKLL